MGKARRGRTGPEQLAARNMYTALWMSLSSRVKTTIIEIKKLYKQYGPSLLYYLLRKYTGLQDSVIRHTVQKVDKLSEYMKTTFKYNVERYCTYSNELVTRL